jgi:hypothetical protein
MKHITVYEQPGVFAGWPANNGLWNWDGKGILVGLTTGAYSEQPGHNIQEPYRSLLARSVDQGDSWTVVRPATFVGSRAETEPLTESIDFTHPGFALRVVGTGYHGSARPAGAFYASLDRGSRWQGPYGFGSLGDCRELQDLEITSRTDYVVEGRHQCLLMMSARGPSLAMDRVFCARTSDGGRSFRFVSWVVPPADPYRAVMPSTIRSGPGRLVSVIRRREPGSQHCWIDAYASADEAQSWRYIAKVGDTGGWNGNPPALTRLRDGRLCCVFGDRATCRIMARMSVDEGRSWDQEVVLRSDFAPDSYHDPDLGYPRVVQRADDRLLAVYYWATQALPHQHIAATIWEPGKGELR